MEGGSLTNEMLRYFGRSSDIATSSAFVQQQGKIHPSAFSSLFDLFVDLNLTTKQTEEVKKLCKDRNHYRIVPSTNTFGYLSRKNRKFDPTVFYKLPFRIVRFQIADGIFETGVTNLDRCDFPASELKLLYNMRWGIENSFRELKYTVGLLHFHAKKVEHIISGIFLLFWYRKVYAFRYSLFMAQKRFGIIDTCNDLQPKVLSPTYWGGDELGNLF